MGTLETELRRARRRTWLAVLCGIAIGWACTTSPTSIAQTVPSYLEVRDAKGATARLDPNGLVFLGDMDTSYGPVELSIKNPKDHTAAHLGATALSLGGQGENTVRLETADRAASLTLGNENTTSAVLRIDGAPKPPHGAVELVLGAPRSRFSVHATDDVDVAIAGQGGFALAASTTAGVWGCKRDGQDCKK